MHLAVLTRNPDLVQHLAAVLKEDVMKLVEGGDVVNGNMKDHLSLSV